MNIAYVKREYSEYGVPGHAMDSSPGCAEVERLGSVKNANDMLCAQRKRTVCVRGGRIEVV